ncbi:MAG TPA: 50S ribosomal protein L6, partial [Leeuwenhoekiella sp.]|nr:50S ribosomal protein L6 [Leeuwenhoekiella sp.]
MSRIGKNPITIPSGVTVDVADGIITVKGKLGELKQEYSNIDIKVEEGVVTLERPSEKAEFKAKHGLYRALIANMIGGVSEGYTKSLELVGVGYRASNQG